MAETRRVCGVPSERGLVFSGGIPTAVTWRPVGAGVLVRSLRRERSFLFQFTRRARFFLGLLGVAGFLGFRHRRVLAWGLVRPLVFLGVRRLGVGCPRR
jgi:hypothetical protein